MNAVPPTLNAAQVSRRAVVRGLGITGGLILSAPLVGCGQKTSDGLKGQTAETSAGDAKLDPSVYLQIDEEGTVHVFIHRVEMGQGSRTGLPMIIADELDADWDRVNFIQGNGDPKYGDQNTDGSTSIRKFYEPFRIAGATARAMLEEAAAQEWGVARSEVKLADHKVTNLVSGEAKDMGAFVAAAAKLPVPAPEILSFKTADERKYVGVGRKIIDMDGIITGTANFGQDVMLDGMLFAVAARPPVVGGTVKSYDKDAAMAVSGVVDVVELPANAEKPYLFKPLGGVAVLATNTWAAMKGRDALNIAFENGNSAAYDTTAFEQQLWDSVSAGGRVALKRGAGADGLEQSAKVFEADYFVPHLVHAPMEPPAATAAFAEDGTLDIYTHGQDPQTVQQTVAPYVGLEPKPDQIRVHSQLLGGAFGRKSKPDFAAEAAILAKVAGKPVKMVWTREDDVRHSYYHTIAAQRVRVGVDDMGMVNAWHHRAAYPSIGETFDAAATGPSDFELSLGLTDMPWQCEHLQVEACDAPSHVRIGWLRSVANIQQFFAVGSMVDEIAKAQNEDTYEYWMQLIGDDRVINPADDIAEGGVYPNYGESADRFPIETARLKAVLSQVKDMSQYGRTMPKGKGMGIAVHRSFVSYVACAVEVSVTDSGMPKVDKAWIAIDCGLAVNPDRVKAQMEGAVIFGISIAMHGKVTAEDGRIVESNYDRYPVARIDETPVTEVHIMDVDAPPGGVGEPGVPPVVAAIAQAVSQATGQRVRRLPIADMI